MAGRESPPSPRALTSSSRLPTANRTADVALVVLSIAAAIPVWLIELLPFQDLPQHLAAIRVLVSLDEQALGIGRFHTVDLAGTPHLAYHLAGALLGRIAGVELGHRLLLTAVVVATPWTVRWLARASGGDSRVSLLVVPLTYGVPMVLGLLPFVAAVPLAVGAIAWALDLRRREATQGHTLGLRSRVGLAALLALAFATHVVPWVIATAGVVLVAWPPRGRGRWVRAAASWLACVPSVGVAAAWLASTSSGADTVAAALRIGGPAEPVPSSVASTFGDVVSGYADDAVLFGVLLLAWAGSLLAAADATPPSARGVRWRLALVASASFAIYLFAPRGYDWIWAIHLRFAWMALVLFVALARFPQGRAGWVLGGVAVVLGCVHPIVITRELRRLEEEEGRGLSAAIDAIPAGRRVAGLVYRPTSRHVRFAPFLHSVAWYQARKGGAIMFSFADYPSWPVRFRPDSRPPRVPSRWEWQPQRVRIPEELAWYEYVLVRGGPGPISAMPELYAPVYRDARWSVWRALSSSARR